MQKLRITSSPTTTILAICTGLATVVITTVVYGQALMRPSKQFPRRDTPQRAAANSGGAQRQQRPSDQPDALGPPGRPFFTRLQIIQTLNLTTDQQAKVHELRDSLGGQLHTLREKLEESRDALNQAIYADTIDYKRIDELNAALREAQGQILQVETRLEVAFRGILSAEQLQRLRDLQAEEMQIRKLQRELNRRERMLREKIRPRSAASQSSERP